MSLGAQADISASVPDERHFSFAPCSFEDRVPRYIFPLPPDPDVGLWCSGVSRFVHRQGLRRAHKYNEVNATISACNALDKILINKNIPNFEGKLKELQTVLKERNVTILVDNAVKSVLKDESLITDDTIWREEFLSLKCCVGAVSNLDEAIAMINAYCGGHSASIMTTNDEKAADFMQEVDCAAVYKNASTRFTDGGQLGVGAELAISTDKLHHRGPLGLKKLVTNKYYIFGDGHIRS